MRILVIDDDPTVARGIARMLRQYDVTTETDPVRGVAVATSGVPFDLVLCDFHMQSLSGADVIRALHAAHLPTICVLMSGTDDVPETGADAVLTKPFRMEHLRSLIAQLDGERLAA